MSIVDKYLKMTPTSNSSDEESGPLPRVKKRLRCFTDSESDTDKEYAQQKYKGLDSDDDPIIKNKSPAKEENTLKDNSDSESDNETVKNEEKELRIQNKRNKIRNKFKSLITSRSKEASKKDTGSDIENQKNNYSEESNDEESINNIKQGIKKSMSFKPSICDPDTSDEEEYDDKTDRLLLKSLNHKKSMPKATTQKPIRMSTKQAMENMHKIKSESNRLLREKEVTLPYHKPKAFSLKDIIRRKQAVTADGKALPIKMNEEQLKQYAQMLEQRQKEIMELCKSDSDEEQRNSNEIKEPSTTANIDNESLDNNKNQAADVLIVEFISTGETSLQQDTQKCNETNNLIHLNSDNTPEIEISSNMVVQKERFIEDNKIKCSLNTENVEIGSLDIHKDPKNEPNKETDTPNMDISEKSADEQIAKISTESESQMLHLHYDSETTIADKLQMNHSSAKDNKTCESDIFSDDDIDMDDIDKMIENAEIMNDVSSDDIIKASKLTATAAQLFVKPKIIGTPGMVIDLDDNDSASSKILSGVELLKERYTYFAKLKTPEELEREREKKSKPGAQHLKLKQELEEMISEQRSLEWAKRLNEEKQHQIELKTLRGEESDAEDDIEKIEAQIDENNVEHEETSEGESEPEEEDLGEIKEKARSKNLMIDDEAEESNCDDEVGNEVDLPDDDNDENEELDGDIDVSCEEQSSEESCDDQLEEETTKRRKGRILKAFEDSDDENGNEPEKQTDSIEVSEAKIFELNIVKEKVTLNNSEAKETTVTNEKEVDNEVGSQIFKVSQDDEIQLAQRMVSVSDDMFTSQESTVLLHREISQGDDDKNILGTQTFSILDSTCNTKNVLSNLQSTQKLSFITDTQTTDDNLGVAVHLCSEMLTQNLIPSHLSSSQQPMEPSQAIGEDVLALCTGNFYDNQFISQSDENNKNGVQDAGNDHFDDSWSKSESQADETNIIINSNDTYKDPKDNNQAKDNDKLTGKDESKENAAVEKSADKNLLQSIIDELHDEGKEKSVNSNKYFVSKNTDSEADIQVKKKFVIESDDELNEDTNEQKKKKKKKKKKLEQRALQISDDEQEPSDNEEEYISELENDAERIVDYDSEENEIEVKQTLKKKRKVADFFENEAELTSEDEWVGSGDEDEADLDRMEREDGDDETFHQGKLQRELGQIHMRDVLDQDKREVRIIQELLFEDGDLGDGHRQRKFRWRNADDTEEPGTVIDDITDTQEDEFESEEQWRKQRHEREIFLRQMKEQDKSEDTPNITINRSTIIKANLSSKTMSTLLFDVNNTSVKTDKPQNSTIKENSIKDIPSPKKGFTILQQNYHNSLLTRGRGALARLAALATPLAIDEDSTNVATVAPKNQRNFVFATVTKEDVEPKIMKRKADSKLDTPRLVKKLRTNDKQTLSRNSLLDHLKI